MEASQRYCWGLVRGNQIKAVYCHCDSSARTHTVGGDRVDGISVSTLKLKKGPESGGQVSGVYFQRGDPLSAWCSEQGLPDSRVCRHLYISVRYNTVGEGMTTPISERKGETVG